jgi:hypothetical protein
MELHAMYLKSKGAMVARTLSYEGCEFEGISNVMSEEMEKVYNRSSDLWMEMHGALLTEVEERRKRKEFEKQVTIQFEHKDSYVLDAHERRMQQIYADSDDEEDECLCNEAEEEASAYRKKCRDRPPHVLNGVFWGAHQRFFRSLCIASKVDVAIETVQNALELGHCCVIGLQSTGEARAKDAAKQACFDSEDDIRYMEDYISDSREGMKRVLMNVFPLPVRYVT